MSRFKWLEFEKPENASTGGKKSAKTLRNGISDDGDDARRVLFSADEAYRNLDFEKALKLYSRTLSIDPNSEDAWAGQLLCLLDLGETPEALTWAVKACKVLPKSPRILSARALALSRLGKSNDAMAFSDNAIQNSKSDWFTWTARGEILAQTSSQSAEFCFLKAIELKPNDWHVTYKIAQACSHAGKLEQSIKHYRKVLAAMPDMAHAWYELGVVQSDLGFQIEACESFEKACGLDCGNKAYAEALTRQKQRSPFELFLGWLKSLVKGGSK